MKQSIFEIKENRALTENVMLMSLVGDTSDIARPGQFVNIKLDGLFLRRPISVCDSEDGTLTLIYKVVGKGTEQMSRMGALIVLERETRLAEIAATGTVIEASPSGELIGNIFFNKAPLHDGAMIIRDGKVLAAGCILPLTENRALSSELGTRHRAAVGMSENSDALIIVVSEETGTISVAERGTLRRHLSPEQLRSELENGMIWARQEAREKSVRGRRKGKKSK